jgi:hypothetical protein
MLDEVAGWDDLVIGLRPATRGTKGKVCQSSYLRWCSETGEGNERRVASPPSPQHMHYDLSTTITHTYVKFSNIVLELDFKAKIVDFGLARCRAPENAVSKETPRDSLK